MTGHLLADVESSRAHPSPTDDLTVLYIDNLLLLPAVFYLPSLTFCPHCTAQYAAYSHSECIYGPDPWIIGSVIPPPLQTDLLTNTRWIIKSEEPGFRLVPVTVDTTCDSQQPQIERGSQPSSNDVVAVLWRFSSGTMVIRYNRR